MICPKKLYAARFIPMPEMCAGYRRYEVVRKLNAQQFAELFNRNLCGEDFDKMVDELIQDANAQDDQREAFGPSNC